MSLSYKLGFLASFILAFNLKHEKHPENFGEYHLLTFKKLHLSFSLWNFEKIFVIFFLMDRLIPKSINI